MPSDATDGPAADAGDPGGGAEASSSEPTAERPVPAAVDWIVTALLVMVGLASALGGAAVLAAIDRSAIREAVAEEELQSDALTDPELVDVTHATLTWVGGGLVVTGAVLAIAGAAYGWHRRGVHRRRAAGEPVSDFLGNAVVGALATLVFSFVPFSQVVGGALAGYLERAASERVLAVGALSGLLSVAPFLLIASFAMAGVAVGLFAIGDAALALGILAALAFTVAMGGTFGAALGAVGGYVGGELADRNEPSADDGA